LPVNFINPKDWDVIEQEDRISVIGLSELSPGKPVTVVVHKKDKEVRIQVSHSMTAQQIGWFQAGSALNALNV
jgi:aconitate hydratase